MRGALKGNRNALKHGFYSRRFTPDENQNLNLARHDNLDEIACLRTHANRLNAWLLEQDPASYDEKYFAAVNTLIHINLSIATLMRTQTLLSGKSSNVEKSIEDAVLSLHDRWTLA